MASADRAVAPVRIPLPKSRDPFVNTPLLALGPGADGVDRFWISTWNNVSGTQGVLLTADGRARRYRFSAAHPGFYSAVAEDADTLWLCGLLDQVVRLSLDTGRYETFATGAPRALVFQGMALDPETGRLFAAAFPPPYAAMASFTFDTRRRAPIAVQALDFPAHYLRNSFPNGDGTVTLHLQNPGEILACWDPRAGTVTPIPLPAAGEAAGGGAERLIADDAGRRYVPGYGWYDPAARAFQDGPRPAREMIWFARRGARAWGVVSEPAALQVGAWDLATGAVQPLCSVPDGIQYGINLTADGRVVAVNLYGNFYRFDGETGALEMTCRLETDSRQYIDCLRRIDADRLLGTPNITQRFWEVNLRTGAGLDCGRAAPGSGEVLQTWRLGGKIYLAAYTGGELMEYDPAVHPHFPENPRVVADPPHGMRPVAAADDGRCLYYSCSLEYGSLGSTVTKYDTRTGEARYCLRPLGNQQIWSLWYDRAARALVGASTRHADCRSCPPTDDRCFFLLLDPDTLKPRARAAAPAGADDARVLGRLGAGRYLAACETPEGRMLFTLEIATLAVPALYAMAPAPAGCEWITPTGRPGRFVLYMGTRLELWDLNRRRRLRVVYPRFDRSCHGYHVDGDTLYVVKKKELLIFEGLLAP